MSRIEWSTQGMSGERGQVNGIDMFHLAYPREWSEGFQLTSPLIGFGDRMGWLGTVELPDSGPETSYVGKPRPSRAQIVADAKADRERWTIAKDAAKAVAESILVDFARSIMNLEGES